MGGAYVKKCIAIALGLLFLVVYQVGADTDSAVVETAMPIYGVMVNGDRSVISAQPAVKQRRASPAFTVPVPPALKRK
jgi:hypothetical protein